MEDAVAIWHAAGDRRREGAALAQLAMSLIAGGRNADADAAAQAAIDMVEPLADGPEKVDAYAIRAYLLMLDRQSREAIAAGRRRSRLGARSMEQPAPSFVPSTPSGPRGSSSAISVAGRTWRRAFAWRSKPATIEASRPPTRTLDLRSGRCTASPTRTATSPQASPTRQNTTMTSRGSTRKPGGPLHLHQGRWSDAAKSASHVLVRPNVATWSRIMASVAVGRLRARRGEPDAWVALDEALALAEQRARSSAWGRSARRGPSRPGSWAIRPRRPPKPGPSCHSPPSAAIRGTWAS